MDVILLVFLLLTHISIVTSKREGSTFIRHSHKEIKTLFCGTRHLPHEHALVCHAPAHPFLRDFRLRYIARRKNFLGAEDVADNTGVSKDMWKCTFVSPDPTTAPALLSSHFK